MSGIVQDLSFCVWSVSFSIMSSRSIPTVAGVSGPFLFEAEEYFVVECFLHSFVLTMRSLRSNMKSYLFF